LQRPQHGDQKKPAGHRPAPSKGGKSVTTVSVKDKDVVPAAQVQQERAGFAYSSR